MTGSILLHIVLIFAPQHFPLVNSTRTHYSTLIHAVVLCESAQQYRVLMVILQSHRTQNMILRCYPTVSAILQRHTKSCLLCFFNNPYISPFEFTDYLSLLFFYMLCRIRREHSSRSILPKKWLFTLLALSACT